MNIFNDDPAPTPEVRIGGEIEFDQIRQGDRVKTVREFEGGFIITMEGIAERLERGNDGRLCWRMGRTHAVAPMDAGALALAQHHILLERG